MIEALTHNEIVKKIEQREKLVPFRDRCLRANVCPHCGDKTYADSKRGHPFLILYKCNNCDFSELKDVCR